jgi:hypothetical protein
MKKNNGFSCVAVTCLLLLLGVQSQAQQQNFRLYGFMDLNFNQFWVESNNFLNSQSFINSRPEIVMGNVNVYMDFRPNDKIRSLIEVAYNSSEYDEHASNKMVMGEVTAEDLGDPVMDMIASQILEGINSQPSGVDEPFSEKRKYGGIYIARAWADLKISDLLTMRAGKFITPAGIWNVDHGSPIIIPILPPRQTAFMPIFPVSQTGLMLHGQAYLGDSDHELKFSAYTSTGRSSEGVVHDNLDNDLEDMADLALGGKLTLAMDFLDGINLGVSGYSGMIKRDEDVTIVNAHLSAEQMGQLVAIAAAGEDPSNAASEMLALPQLDKFSYSERFIQKDRETALGVDLKLKVSGLTLQGEFNTMTMQNELMLDEKHEPKEATFVGYYGLLAYELGLTENSSVSPYAMYENISWKDVENTPGLGLDGTPLDGFSTLKFGLNFSFFNNYKLKTEYIMVKILQDKEGGYPGADNFAEGDLDMQQFAAQISVAF